MKGLTVQDRARASGPSAEAKFTGFGLARDLEEGHALMRPKAVVISFMLLTTPKPQVSSWSLGPLSTKARHMHHRSTVYCHGNHCYKHVSRHILAWAFPP